MSWLRNRWYLWLGILAWLATLGAVLFLWQLDPDCDCEAAPVLRHAFPLALALHITTYLWLFWACPYLDAANVRAYTILTPRWRLRWLQLILWGPVELSAALAITRTLGPAIERKLGYGTLTPWPLVMTAVVGTLILIPISWWLTLRLGRRYRDQLAAARLCFRCGYDLRGSPHGACPECGWASPSASAVIP